MPSDPEDRCIRLTRYLARAGVASRRKATDVIRRGRVSIDGVKVTSPGAQVRPGVQEVTVDGVVIRPPQPATYLVLNKPAGVLTTTSDPGGRPTVMDLLPGRRGLFPVGRLDMDSEGLVLATDDGLWADRVMHPAGGIEKVYRALLPVRPAREALAALVSGIQLADGASAAVVAGEISSDQEGTWIELVMIEGRNRQVRRMLASLGHQVSRLVRIAIGPVELGGLRSGQWRELTSQECRQLGPVEVRA